MSNRLEQEFPPTSWRAIRRSDRAAWSRGRLAVHRARPSAAQPGGPRRHARRRRRCGSRRRRGVTFARRVIHGVTGGWSRATAAGSPARRRLTAARRLIFPGRHDPARGDRDGHDARAPAPDGALQRLGQSPAVRGLRAAGRGRVPQAAPGVLRLDPRHPQSSPDRRSDLARAHRGQAEPEGATGRSALRQPRRAEGSARGRGRAHDRAGRRLRRGRPGAGRCATA